MSEEPTKSSIMHSAIAGKTFRFTEISMVFDRKKPKIEVEPPLLASQKKPFRALAQITGRIDPKTTSRFFGFSKTHGSGLNRVNTDRLHSQPTLESIKHHIQDTVLTGKKSQRSTDYLTTSNCQRLSTEAARLKTPNKDYISQDVLASPHSTPPFYPPFLSARKLTEEGSHKYSTTRKETKVNLLMKVIPAAKNWQIKSVYGIDCKEYLDDWNSKLQKDLNPTMSHNDETIVPLFRKATKLDQSKNSPSLLIHSKRKKNQEPGHTIDLPPDIFRTEGQIQSQTTKLMKRSNTSGLDKIQRFSVLQRQNTVLSFKHQKTLQDLTFIEDSNHNHLAESPFSHQDFFLNTSLKPKRRNATQLTMIQLPNATVDICETKDKKFLKIIPQETNIPKRKWSPKMSPQSTLTFFSYEPKAYALCKAVIDSLKLLKAMNCEDKLILDACLKECSIDSVIVSLLFGNSRSKSLVQNLQGLLQLAERGRSHQSKDSPISLNHLVKSKRQYLADLSKSNNNSPKSNSKKSTIDYNEVKRPNLVTLQRVHIRLKKLCFEIHCQRLVQELETAYKLHHKLLYNNFEANAEVSPVVPVKNHSHLLDMANDTCPQPVFIKAEKQRRAVLLQRAKRVAIFLLKFSIEKEKETDHPSDEAIVKTALHLIEKGVGSCPWTEEEIIALEREYDLQSQIDSTNFV